MLCDRSQGRYNEQKLQVTVLYKTLEDSQPKEPLREFERKGAGEQQTDPEKAPITKARGIDRQEKKFDAIEQDRMRATWLLFLGELHETYKTYRLACKEDNSQGQNSTGVPSDSQDRTEAVVRFQCWSWDAMPPDLPRPFASMPLGDIVVLAFRIGMRWRAVNQDGGRMVAEGNGYYLSGADQRGMGLVFTFGISGIRGGPPPLIPGRVTDKMLCGILVGCPRLVQQEFHCVDDNRKNLLPDCVYDKIGVPFRGPRNSDRERRWIESHNEAVILLSTFLPLKGCSLLSHGFPGGYRPTRKSVHMWWEGRYGLYYKLTDRLHRKCNSECREILEGVKEQLERLQETWASDFFDLWGQTALEGKCPLGGDASIKEECSRKFSGDCRDVFDWTTENLVRLGFDHCFRTGQTGYVTLVAAHVAMSMYVLPEMETRIRRRITAHDDRSQDAQWLLYKLPTGKYRPRWFGEETFISAQIYGEKIEKELNNKLQTNDKDHGIIKFVQERGVENSGGEIEAAWWVTMLRGIVWTMSSSAYDSGRLGQPVPSSLYDDKTPVSMT